MTGRAPAVTAPTMTMLAPGDGTFEFATPAAGAGVAVRQAPGGLWRVAGDEPVAYADAVAAIMRELARAGAVESVGAAPIAHCLDIIEKAKGGVPKPASKRGTRYVAVGESRLYCDAA